MTKYFNVHFCFLTGVYRKWCRKINSGKGVNLAILLIGSIILLYPSCIKAQQLYEPYIHFANENGLPQASVIDMETDNNGYVWVGTYNGLARFDGSHFAIFNLWEYNSTSSNRIYKVSRSGNRLVVQEFYKSLKFEITGRGSIRLITDTALSQHLYYNPLRKRYDYQPNLPAYHMVKQSVKDEYLFALDETYNKGYYVDNDNRVIYYDRATEKKTGIYWGDLGWNSCFANDDVLYTWDGISRLFADKYGSTAEVINGSLPRLLKRMQVNERAGLYFISSATDIFMITASKIFRILVQPDGSVNEELLAGINFQSPVTCIALLKDSRTLLIGTGNDGLYIYKKKLFKTLLFPVSGDSVSGSGQLTVSSNSYIAPVELYKDSFFIASDKGMLCADGKVYPLPGRSSVISGSLTKSSNGYFLFKEPGQDKKLFIADSVLSVVKELPCTSSKLAGYYNDGDTIYQSFYDGQIYKLLLGKNRSIQLLDKYKVPHYPVSRTYVSKVAPDTLLVACRDTMYLLSIRTKKIKPLPGIGRYIEINSLYTDKDGTAWIGTTGQGWYRYRHGSGLFRMPLDRNKYLLSTVSFTEDGNGYMWIGTFYGLFRVMKSEVDKIKDPDDLFFYNHFTRSNGLLSDEFTGEYSNNSLRFPDQRMLLCNAVGLVLFDPNTVPVEQPAERISFGNVWVNDVLKNAGPALVLNPGFNNLSVEVQIPYMGNPYNLQVQYQLSGVDDNWTFLPDNRIIRLNRLPGGNYTLSVRMLKGYGTGEFITSTFQFRVLPHWYQTWWFFALLLLCLNLLLIWYFRNRSKQMKLQKKILEQQVEERTKELRQSEELVKQNARFKSRVTSLVLHDVRSPLFYLKKITLSIYNSTEGTVPEVYREQLKELHLSVKEVSEYAQNLFAWVNSQQDDFVMKKSRVKLFDVFEELCGNYHLMAEQNGNNISHSANDTLAINTQADLLMIVLRNLVDNAIKYTSGGKIVLSARAMPDGMHIMVWDTGRGMSEEKVNLIMSDNGNNESDTRSGMGFRYVKDLLKKMNGRLIVQSEQGTGSAITIVLPLDQK